MKLLVALVGLFISLAAAEPVTHQPTRITFPDEIGEFRLAGIEDYEPKHPGLGVAYHYRAEASRVVGTVYVYTAGLSPVPASVGHPLMQKLREQTTYEVTEYARRRGETTRQLASDTLTIGDTAVLFDAFVIDSPGGMRHTYVWLWSSRAHIMKIRASSLAAKPDPDQLKAFAEFVVRLAARPADWKKGATLILDRFAAQEERTAWLAYGIGLMDWINKNDVVQNAAEGPFVPSFAAELHAREAQLRIWREMKGKDAVSLPYMDALLRVSAAGFLREYLWRHHRRPDWTATPADLRMEAFEKWQADNLPGHVPQTGARVVIEWSPPR